MIMKTRKKIITNETQDYTTNTDTRKNNQTKGKLNPRKEKKKMELNTERKTFFFIMKTREFYSKKKNMTNSVFMCTCVTEEFQFKSFCCCCSFFFLIIVSIQV